ncbi:MAG: PorP/SprF family type IX secretion system membrane protein [Flavobacteriaceae bacterium]
MTQKYSFCLLTFLVAFLVHAQQDPHVSLYRYHMNMINPAVSGIKEASFLNMSLRSQWQGVQGAPETQVVSFGTPTRSERVGLGINVIHDRTYVEEQTLVFGSFSYRLPLTEKADLFLGLQAGTNGYSVNAAGLDAWNPQGQAVNDANLLNYSRFNPNIGVGAYLQHEKYYLSLSAPKILATERFKEIDGMVTTAADRVHFYASGAYYFSLNDQWELIPSLLVCYVNFAPFLVTSNLSFSYKKAIDFGVEYSFKSGLGGTLMVNTNDTFSFGYAYITSLHKDINTFSKGTHEVVMKIKLSSGFSEKDHPMESKLSKLEKKIGLKNKNESQNLRYRKN